MDNNLWQSSFLKDMLDIVSVLVNFFVLVKFFGEAVNNFFQIIGNFIFIRDIMVKVRFKRIFLFTQFWNLELLKSIFDFLCAFVFAFDGFINIKVLVWDYQVDDSTDAYTYGLDDKK